MKKVFLLIVSLFFAVNALAQTKVKGVVVDSSNQPLIGAGIVQVGNTTNGTVSDIDGSFSLNVPETASLQVSCVGYTTKIVNIEGRTQLTIILDENSELLNDVVVVAFGQMKKEAFTGSAGTMKSEELAKVQVTNAASALAGRVAGLQINNSSSQLGSSPSITIRGVSSISSGTEPLIVIDGMPFDGDLNLVNTNDIETMTVLKDAASNALYGARGANGVIMITTKRATSSDAKITFDAKWGVNQKGLRNYKTTNAREFFETYYNMLYNTYVKEEGATAESAHRKANAGLFDSGIGPGYVPYTMPTGQDFILAGGGGIAVVGSLHIGLHQRPDSRNRFKKLQAHRLRLFLRLRLRHADGLIHQNQLAVQVEHHVLNEHGEIVLHIIDAVGFIPVVAGVDNPQQLLNHVGDDFLVRMAEQVDFVNIPSALIVGENAIHHTLNLRFNGIHDDTPLCCLYHTMGSKSIGAVNQIFDHRTGQYQPRRAGHKRDGAGDLPLAQPGSLRLTANGAQGLLPGIDHLQMHNSPLFQFLAHDARQRALGGL